MSYVCLVLLILWSVGSLCIAFAVITGSERYRFVEHPVAGVASLSIGILLAVGSMDAIAGFGRGGPLVLVPAFGGVAILPVISLVSGVGKSIYMPGASKIRLEKRCDAGQAAERKGDLAEAERLYKEALSDTPEEDMHIRLALGNLYLRQKRYGEAAESLRIALDGRLPEDTRLATAVRLADILVDKLDDRPGAVAVLKGALEAHPDGREARAVRARLDMLEKA